MKRLVWIALAIVLLASASPAYADVAPPANPPGANPGPGSDGTQVRMVAETVLIEVLMDSPANSLGRARVTADFTMRNLGTQSETMAARFPISADDGFGRFPEIQNLEVEVAGRTVGTRRIEGPDPNGYNAASPWAEFDVTFPPGEDVPIRVTYTMDGTGELAFVTFAYILTTGADWNGTIGSADLIVRLPYEASSHNILLDYETGWGSTTPGGVISGKEIRWRFEDFEPEQNLTVALVRPASWTPVLTERENVAADPGDGEAWGRLGRAYKEVISTRREPRQDAGGLELYDLGVEAYENALAILPGDGLWHAGFADLLATHAYWMGWQGVDIRPDSVRAMQEIRTALELSPKNATVRQIAEQIMMDFPDGIQQNGDEYTFLWLTATPTMAPPTATLEAPPPAGATPQPATGLPAAPPTSPPAPTEAQTGGGLPCGTAALVAAPMIVLVVTRRRPTHRV